ncbi:MAG: lipid A deacylase LpxR family protein [Gammaproteobacteria bacterium]|nr:lipid A deacylase LpxR family protein [Gammaproteobacteria bacterium]
MPKFYLPFFFSLLLCANSALAQDDAPWSFNFFLENDLFANTDLNYTNGLRLSSISPELDSFQDQNGLKYPWVEKLSGMLEFVHPEPANPDADPVKKNIVISFGQLMFTPADDNRVTLDPNDRPYAGYLYLGLGYHASTSTTLHSTEFNFGVVGPAALTRQSQKLVHRIRGPDQFQGWHNQLKNEAVFQLIFERKKKHGTIQAPLFNNLEIEVITHWGGSLGNVASYINDGGEIRTGWDLPNDFGTSTLRPDGDNNTPGNIQNNNSPFRLHLFLSLDGRVVGNNIFLDGNTFKSSHSVHLKNSVADISAGISGTWKKFRFSYAQIYRTREFQKQTDPQECGSFSFSYRHQF